MSIDYKAADIEAIKHIMSDGVASDSPESVKALIKQVQEFIGSGRPAFNPYPNSGTTLDLIRIVAKGLLKPFPAQAVPDWLVSKLLVKLDLAKSLANSEIKNSVIDEAIEILASAPTPPSAEQISPMEKDKAKNWDYYQELLKQNGFCGITDLLTKYHALERSIEQPDSAAPYVFFKKINGKDEWSSWNEFSDGSNGGKPLYEHPQAKPQRITEQDARDIFDCFVAYYGVETGPLDFECWKSGIGHALLAKLNENREPDCKASEWRPIETAPKDGSMIWISDGKKITVALWYKGNTEDYWKDWFLSSKVDKKKLVAWMPLPDISAIAKHEGGENGQ